MKKIFTIVLLTISIFAASQLSFVSVAKADCDHYFEQVVINGVRYLIEYSCDGSIVAVTVIEE